MSTVISIEHLSKAHRLGQIGTPLQENASTGPAARTLSYDLKLWWAKLRGTWRRIRWRRLVRMTGGRSSAHYTPTDLRSFTERRSRGYVD